MESKNIIIAGVGGQGTLLASKMLGRVLLGQGLDVKVSEVHGMSQRGGSVITYVRCGEKVYSPVIDKGGADIILSFELLEAARWTPYLRKGGLVVTNNRKIDPMPVITGAAAYPDGLEEAMRAAGVELDSFDATSLAIEAGTVKAANLVLLGRLSLRFGFGMDVWMEALEQTVPAKFLETNRKAFLLGRRATTSENK